MTPLWSDEEIALLRELYPQQGRSTKIPGKTMQQIVGKAGHLKIKVVAPRKQYVNPAFNAKGRKPETKKPRQR